jgi:hypothetical protein
MGLQPALDARLLSRRARARREVAATRKKERRDVQQQSPPPWWLSFRERPVHRPASEVRQVTILVAMTHPETLKARPGCTSTPSGDVFDGESGDVGYVGRLFSRARALCGVVSALVLFRWRHDRRERCCCEDTGPRLEESRERGAGGRAGTGEGATARDEAGGGRRGGGGAGRTGQAAFCFSLSLFSCVRCAPGAPRGGRDTARARCTKSA